MKTPPKLAPILYCLAGISSLATAAAPSTSLPNEWFVPMETTDGFALVDKASGQVRFHQLNGSGELNEIGPLETRLSDITGISSGFVDNSQEHVIVSSVTSNRVAILSQKSVAPHYVYPSTPGPENAFVFDQSGTPENTILISSRYANGGHGLEMLDEVLSPEPVQLDGIGPIPTVRNALPLFDPVSGDRGSVASYGSAPTNRVLHLIPDGGSIDGNVKAESFAMGSTLTTQVIGKDGRICTIAYTPGSATAEVFTHSFGGFTENLAPSLPIGFAIGSISPVPDNIPNAQGGILITSQDGGNAAYAQVIPDAAEPSEFEFSFVETFKPTAGQQFTGLLPVPNQGFIALQGDKAQISTTWRFFANEGSGWTEVASGELTPWNTSLTPEFATLFWYDSTPIVDPTAELLQLDIVPDWTLGGGKIPTALERETFVSTNAGLDNPIALPASAPSGAAYVMTSQVQANTSVAALADTFLLTIPSIRANPESGTYNTSVVFNLLFDEQTTNAYYRRATDATWTQYTGPVTIGYPTELIFYAQDINSGHMGPIMSREFDFSVDLLTLDSDRDGVPDFVEEHEGIDPSAGADTDLDLQPDLEEILGYETMPDTYVSTLPGDDSSNIDPENRVSRFLGEGFFLYAQAYNTNTGFAAPYNDGGTPTSSITRPVVDETILNMEIEQQALDREDDTPGTNLFVFDMRSTLLTRGEVTAIPSGPLAGSNAARLDVTSSLPDREWLILSTPTYFGLGSTQPAPRNGRETFRIVQNPAFDLPLIAVALTGTDLAADAQAWIDAARTAYASFDPATAITRIDPIDTVIAALGEQVLFDALAALSASEKSELGVPTELAEWTLFATRDGEADKTSCSQEMLDALIADGCDFESMLQVIDTEVRASGTLTTLANAIYDRHVAVSETNPLMALPLDAWRSILRNGEITDPAPGDPKRTDPYTTIDAMDLNDAQTDLAAIITQALATKRNVEMWTLTIEEATTPGHSYDYRRLMNNNLAWLTDASGERFILEQGLGLNIGTTYMVSGYTDVDQVLGFDTMEIISIDSVVTPVATDADINANLLDDSWEKFFFGELGAVNALDPHPESGHSYLQYHAAGVDPRSGDLAEPIFAMIPVEIDIEWNGSPINAYDIEFTFPDEYIGNFEFGLSSTADLSVEFSGSVEQASPVYVSPNRYELRVEIPASNLDQNFFQITMGLSTED